MAAGMLRHGAVGPECVGSRAGGGGSARVLHITKLNVQVRVNFAAMGKTQNSSRVSEYIHHIEPR
jgi:formyltetrahydrofolate synthetase